MTCLNIRAYDTVRRYLKNIIRHSSLSFGKMKYSLIFAHNVHLCTKLYANDCAERRIYEESYKRSVLAFAAVVFNYMYCYTTVKIC